MVLQVREPRGRQAASSTHGPRACAPWHASAQVPQALPCIKTPHTPQQGAAGRESAARPGTQGSVYHYEKLWLR